MPEIKPSDIQTFTNIKVVGVGGAGGSAVNRMKAAGLTGVEFIAMNTDAQALQNSKADVKLHLGKSLTGGRGAGADPAIGESAANESRQDIKQLLEGADMVFVTIGAGGGTGSGAGHVVAEVARDLGILTVGVATKPFSFEGKRRSQVAEWAIAQLGKQVDTLITIPNDRLLQMIDQRTLFNEAFKLADDVLRQGVQGISELVTEHGLINLDFADVKAIMKDAGSALMGIGRASGDDRATKAAQQAIESPLVEVSIDGAKGVLFNITGGYDMSMSEVQEAADIITSAVSPEANIIFGANIKEELEDELIITVIATGFDSAYFHRQVVADVPAEQATNMEPTVSESDEEMEAVAEQEANNINLDDYDHDEAAKIFNEEDSKVTDIWDKPEDDNDETEVPAFLRRNKKEKTRRFFGRKKSDEDESK